MKQAKCVGCPVLVAEVNRPSVLCVLCCFRSEQAKCVECPVLLQK